MMFPLMRIVLFIVFVFKITNVAGGGVQLAILHLEGDSGKADVCAVYNPYYAAIPSTLDKTEKLEVLFPQDPTGCSNYVQKSLDVSSFVTSAGNCSHFQKLQKAYFGHAKQVIILSESGSTDDLPKGTPSEHKQIHLTVGLVRDSTLKHVTKLIGNNLFAQLYHPHDPLFDPNLIAIWVIAVFTVLVGAYWCGVDFEKSSSKSNNVIDHSFYDLEQSYADLKRDRYYV